MKFLRRACAQITETLVGALRGGKPTLAGLWLVAALSLPAHAANYTQGQLSAAKTAMVDIDRGNWDGAHAVASRERFPLLEKLVEWFDLTRSATPADFARVSVFIDQNPDWPLQAALRKHAEDAITDATPPSQIIAWFQRYAPIGPNGATHYVDALAATGQKAQAEATARQFLIDGTMTGGQVIEFNGRYSAMLRPADFDLRADRLIWAGDLDGATQLLPFLTPDRRAVAQARIALASQSPSASALVSALSTEQQNDLGLLYERMRWARRQGRDSDAIALLAIAPPTLPHADRWWNERAILARHALDSGDAKGAYELSRDHRQATGAALADGEWLSGWIALRFLKDPQAAQRHFDLMLGTVTTPISVARGAYWAGRAAEALGDSELAARNYRRAAAHIGTFYGQLALAKIDPGARLSLPPEPAIAGLDARSFSNHELVQVTELLAAIGLAERGDPFVRRIAELARTPEDELLAMRLAKTNKSLAAEVQVAKKLMQGGLPVLADGYPLISPLGPKAPEAALVHAIIRQESLFDAHAISPSGALGLMQLMPATAKIVAGKLKAKKFKTPQLTADPRLNIALGSDYLAGLIDHFNGSYILAIGGYNAGPGRVSGWLRDNGDPRPKLDDVVDWIEKITVTETRNYVQRVVENLEIYRARLAGGSAPNGIVADLTR